jgi:hypothetical protein
MRAEESGHPFNLLYNDGILLTQQQRPRKQQLK